MDMMGMDMGGMDMSSMSSGMFKPEAFEITKAYWFIIAVFCGLGLIANIYGRLNASSRIRQIRADQNAKPTIPRTIIAQRYATVVAILREMSYPQIYYITKLGLSWLTPPSLGRCLVLFTYWITIVVMLVTNSVVQDAYYYERLAFRAAWITLMQIPFIVLLSMKLNIIGFLIGSSYERLNWLHRWVSRTTWVCATIHGGFFWTEWVRADFVADELQMMPMVKYGIGAWFVLLWMIISGLVPIRRLAYEVFVIQHLVSAAVFVWLIYVHCPEYAQQYIWMTVAILAADRVGRWAWFVVRNINVFRAKGKSLALADRVGYRAELQAVPGETTRVTLKNVPFKWRAGQHLYLSIPSIGFVEAHPFTISNTCTKDGSLSSATFAIRAHGGFSKRLLAYASKHGTHSRPVEVRALVQGPYGAHPAWNTFDSVILISASTGCSFTLPILEEVIQDPACVRQVTFMLLVRQRPQCSCYLQRLRELASQAAETGLAVRVQIVITGMKTDDDDSKGDVVSGCVCGPDTPADLCCCGGGHGTDVETKVGDLTIATREAVEEEVGIVGSCCSPVIEEKPQIASCCAAKNEDTITEKPRAPRKSSKPRRKRSPSEKRVARTIVREQSVASSEKSLSDSQDEKSSLQTKSSSASSYSSTGKGIVEFSSIRPDLADYIRYPVEQAHGETCIAVCGGKPLTSYVRNAVASLSDERAVHKGTGAQGIFLHVEEFGW